MKGPWIGLMAMVGLSALCACQATIEDEGGSHDEANLNSGGTLTPSQPITVGTVGTVGGGSISLACTTDQVRVSGNARTSATANERMLDAAYAYCDSIGCTASQCTIAAVNEVRPSGSDNQYHYYACVESHCSGSDGGADGGTSDGGDEWPCDGDGTCGVGEGPWCEDCTDLYCENRCGWIWIPEYRDADGNPFGLSCPDQCGTGFQCNMNTSTCEFVGSPGGPAPGDNCNMTCASAQCGMYNCTNNGQAVTVVCGSCASSDGHPGDCGVEGLPGSEHATCFYAYSEDPPQSKR